MLKRILNQAGFTFIEAILTTMLLSVGLWGGYAIMQNSTEHTINNDLIVIASQLANKKVDTILADKTFQGYTQIIPSNYPSETLTPPFNGFTRSTNITEVDPTDLTTPSSGSGFKKVDVMVTWGTQPGQTVTVSTLVTDYS